MAEQKMKREKLIMLAESSVMLALSIVLSMVKIWEMPMGGSITLLSMLPVCLLSARYGVKGALPVAFLNSAVQLFMGIASGNVFVYCATPLIAVMCALFDYIVPYSVLGFAGIFKKKLGNTGFLLGVVLCIFLRFICHYITGVAIWGQWAENMSPYLYSLIYNGQYMLPECVLTCAGAFILIKSQVMERITGKTA